jgi:hypothetical protein
MIGMWFAYQYLIGLTCPPGAIKFGGCTAPGSFLLYFEIAWWPLFILLPILFTIVALLA